MPISSQPISCHLLTINNYYDVMYIPTCSKYEMGIFNLTLNLRLPSLYADECVTNLDSFPITKSDNT